MTRFGLIGGSLNEVNGSEGRRPDFLSAGPATTMACADCCSPHSRSAAAGVKRLHMVTPVQTNIVRVSARGPTFGPDACLHSAPISPGNDPHRLLAFGNRLIDGWEKSSSNRYRGKSSSVISTVMVVEDSIWIGPYGPSNSITVCWLC